MKKSWLFFIVLLSFVLFLSLGTQKAQAAEDAGMETFTIPAYVQVNGASESTPHPGTPTFHFNIWCSNSSIELYIVSNVVYTNGFGEFSGDLVFKVPSEQVEALKTSTIHIQQYDGNSDWKFDTRVYDFYWALSGYFGRWPAAEPANAPKVMVKYVYVTNVYDPQSSAPDPNTSVETFTIPATVVVNGASEATPHPGNPAFHFNIWSGNTGIKLNIVSNVVYTSGFGEFSGNLVFTVPQSQAAALKASPLYVQQFDGNDDWIFDTYVMQFEWADDAGFWRWPRADVASAPKVKRYDVYVTNIYDPKAKVPQTDPVQPTQPEPQNTPETSTSEVIESPIEIIEDDDKTQITLPINVGVEKYSTDTPPAAVFHFGIYGMRKAQEYEWVNDVVYTQGEGIYQGSICFTVPAGEPLEQLIETGFDVRERSAVVPGWSFAGEVYHIDLSRKDGVLQAEIRRLRNVTTAESGKKVLYFLNHYGMDQGEPVTMPGSALGIEDIFRNILDMDCIVLSDTIHYQNDDGQWEISWTALRKDKAIGDFDLTLKYAEEDEDYEEFYLTDVLRVTRDGIFIKLGKIAEVYTELCGKDFPAADAIPDGKWTGFTQETISWLNLPMADELIRRMIRDAGRVFDEFETECVDQGYEMTGDSELWDSFEMLALDMAQLYHEEWYDLALQAAASKDAKDFVSFYEDTFVEFNDLEMNNAGLMYLLRQKYPEILTDFAFRVLLQEDGINAAELSGQLEDEEDGVRIFDSLLEVQEAAGDAKHMGAPKNYESGSDYLNALIMEKANPKDVQEWMDEISKED